MVADTVEEGNWLIKLTLLTFRELLVCLVHVLWLACTNGSLTSADFGVM